MAQRQREEAEEARRRTEALEKQIAEIKSSAEANSASAKQRMTEMMEEKLAEQAQAARLEKESLEAQKDALLKEKRLNLTQRRWATLRAHAWSIVREKKKSKDSWRGVL